MREGASAGPRTARKVGALLGALFLVLVVIPVSFLAAVLDDAGPGDSDETTKSSRAETVGTSTPPSDVRARPNRGRMQTPADAPSDTGDSLGAPRSESSHGPGEFASDARGEPNAEMARADGPASVAARGEDGDSTSASGSTPRSRRPAEARLVVQVVAAESGEPLGDTEVLLRQSGLGPLRYATASDGRAHFVVPQGASADLELKAPGRVRAWRDGVLAAASESRVTVQLERGVVVVGQATGPRGGMRDVTVRAFRWEQYRRSVPFAAEPRAVATTTTRRGGMYELDCLPRGAPCCITFDDDPHVTALQDIQTPPDPDVAVRCDAFMGQGVPLQGAVCDESGAPIEGAWVYAVEGNADLSYGALDFVLTELDLLESLRSFANGRSAALPSRGRTDERGRYRVLVPVTWTSHVVLAMHAAHGRSRPSEPRSLGANPPTLVLPGRVTRSHFFMTTRDGRPADGLTLAPYFPWETWSVSSIGSGTYGHADLDDGPVAIVVSGSAGAPGVYVGLRANSTSVRWKGTVDRGDTWAGIVRDDRQQGVPLATLRAGLASGWTQRDGRFVLKGVHPQTTELEVSAPGHMTVVAFPRYVRGEVAIELPRASQARFVMRLPQGMGAPSWYRIAVGPAEGVWLPGTWEDRLEWSGGSAVMAYRTADDQRIAVFVPGCEVLLLFDGAAPGQVRELGTHELVRARDANGIVVDEDGRPIAGAAVTLRVEGERPWRHLMPEQVVRTDADGRFKIRVVAPGEPARLIADAPGFTATPEIFYRMRDEQRVVLRRGIVFRGAWTGHVRERMRARLTGEGTVFFADVPIAADGTFEADVPSRPVWVEVTDGTRDVARFAVPPSLPDGEVFRFP